MSSGKNVSAISDLEHLALAVPPWLQAVMHVPRSEGHASVDDCAIHYFTWGDPRYPALVFVHGRMSHARCWAFIAPLLAHRFYCVALDLSGMGDSGHRESYSYATRASEVSEVLKASGADGPAMMVTHSYGAVVGLNAIREYAPQFRGLIACDPNLAHPDEWSSERPRTDGPELARPGRVYPDLETALSRFRLAPPQDSVEPVLEHYIARHSLEQVAEGWRWKFDPHVYSSHEEGHNDWWVSHSRDFTELEFPKAIIYGRNSAFASDATVRAICDRSPTPIPSTGIPQAHHHIMVDQPIALATSIEAMVDALDMFSEFRYGCRQHL